MKFNINTMRRALLGGLCVGILGFNVQAMAEPNVTFKTSVGEFTVEVYPDKAPRSVENFLTYANNGFYQGTIFHRVINGFMVQGGGFTKDMQQKPPRAPIPLESRNGLKNTFGTVAMARTSDPNSATAQFFINVVDNPGLDYPQPDGYGYAVFGKIIAGIETINKIRTTPTTSYGPHRNVPVTPIIIENVIVK
jgi:peptidyl-prolyl cis-trans isomerase A (cyclophilin A)